MESPDEQPYAHMLWIEADHAAERRSSGIGPVRRPGSDPTPEPDRAPGHAMPVATAVSFSPPKKACAT